MRSVLEKLQAKDAILEAAREILAAEPRASVERIARGAGVSRGTFYRHFGSRLELLAALKIEPDPVSRERVLVAAAELVARDGLAGLSMDELAAVANISRASVYRLFPGKPALFAALMTEYAPFGQLIEALDRAGGRPPEEVLPEILGLAARSVGSRMSLMRAVFVEVTAGSPDAVEGASAAIAGFTSAMGGYLGRQMALGRLRPTHPVLAVQVVIGPLFFHLLTRQAVERLGGMDVPLDEAVDEFLQTALRALRPDDSLVSPGSGP